jgi:threonine aldolase
VGVSSGAGPPRSAGGGGASLPGMESGHTSLIDLRSDTATRPTAEMRAAIAGADVGDEQLREDPTVNELQRRAAELLGQEAALFLPTATMANQIALRILGRAGGVLIAEERTHCMIYEAGGPAVHSGLVMRGLPGHAGRLTPEQLREVAETSDEGQPASVVVFENTHRSAGGRVWPLRELDAAVETARELGLAVHLDGARLLNAAVAAGVPASDYGRLADSVTLCFSKGLGCPLGAVLASSAERIELAWEGKFLFGGAMRQAGIVAAAALYALDHNVERLAEDHRRARQLAEGLAAAGLPIDLEAVETNFVGIALEPLGMSIAQARGKIADQGVLVSVMRPGVLRAATYLGIGDDDVTRASESIPRALGALVGA